MYFVSSGCCVDSPGLAAFECAAESGSHIRANASALLSLLVPWPTTCSYSWLPAPFSMNPRCDTNCLSFHRNGILISDLCMLRCLDSDITPPETYIEVLRSVACTFARSNPFLFLCLSRSSSRVLASPPRFSITIGPSPS